MREGKGTGAIGRLVATSFSLTMMLAGRLSDLQHGYSGYGRIDNHGRVYHRYRTGRVERFIL